MKSTAEQRIATTIRIATGRGENVEAATLAAYALEGLTPPSAPVDETGALEAEIEELHFKLQCERRRADAATARARVSTHKLRTARLEVEAMSSALLAAADELEGEGLERPGSQARKAAAPYGRPAR